MPKYNLDRLSDLDADTIDGVPVLTAVRDALHEGPFDVQPMITYSDFKADNAFRAAWVATGLIEYAGITGTLEQESPHTIIGDFLSDLRHLLDALPLDENGNPPPSLEELVERSSIHYEAEIEGML
jgi:hypothetical protein